MIHTRTVRTSRSENSKGKVGSIPGALCSHASGEPSSWIEHLYILKKASAPEMRPEVMNCRPFDLMMKSVSWYSSTLYV